VLTPARELALHSRRGRMALLATVLASSTAMLDATIANVALPHIAEDLDVGVSGLQWVINGYLLTLASLILLGGALGDRFGRRRVFVIGAVWFGAASLLCAVAPSLNVLVLARMLQGVGGALLTPTSLALTQASFVAEDRGKAVGAWSGLGGLAGAVGPFVGGWVVDGPGWRWAFLLNVPLVVLTLIAARALPESSRGGNAHIEDRKPERSFDVGGTAIGAVTLAALTWSITEAPERGWTDATVLAGFLVAVVGAVCFVVVEQRVRDPLVPAHLFASRTFTVLNIATFALYATIGTLFFLLVFQLQITAGWSAIAAGSALIPATFLMLIGSAKSGEVATRIGPRPQLVVGPLLLAGGMLLLARVDRDADWVPDVLPGALLFGLGLVVFVAPLTASVMGCVDPAWVSTASGVNNAVARTGGLLAVAVIPSVSGLTTAHGPGAVTDAFRVGMIIAAALAIVASAISAVGLPRRVRASASARRYHCAVDGTPLQPDPAVCPPPAAAAGISARGD
jgi:EmrB/QacA subfamily drug resistance transporter